MAKTDGNPKQLKDMTIAELDAYKTECYHEIQAIRARQMEAEEEMQRKLEDEREAALVARVGADIAGLSPQSRTALVRGVTAEATGQAKGKA